MKKYIIAGCMLLCAMLAACEQKEAKLVGIQFERGHGSQWGNQFYVEVTAREIVITRYFQTGASEQTVREHVPLSQAQWECLADTLRTLELKEAQDSWLDQILGFDKVDGGEFRRLTLTWETEKGTKRVSYQWPQDVQAASLEALLEQLARTA